MLRYSLHVHQLINGWNMLSLLPGDNRGELEKVLEHYGQEPEKLEAARFLIRNMPHWYAYEGWQLDSVRQMLALRNVG